MPFYFIKEIVHDTLYPTFRIFNIEYCYNRGDMCLQFNVIHNAMSGIHNSYTNTCNLFGVSELKCELEAGNLNGDLKKASYYMVSKKDYSDRFTADCHRQHFEVMLKNTLVVIDDYPVYQ